MSDIEYLTLEDALALVRALGIGPVTDVGLLDSAMGRPRSSAYGEDAYPTLEDKAAALLHSLARHPSLAGGNKCLAWLATVTFVDLNGFEVGLSDDEALSLVIKILKGELNTPDIALKLTRAMSPDGPLDQVLDAELPKYADALHRLGQAATSPASI